MIRTPQAKTKLSWSKTPRALSAPFFKTIPAAQKLQFEDTVPSRWARTLKIQFPLAEHAHCIGRSSMSLRVSSDSHSTSQNKTFLEQNTQGPISPFLQNHSSSTEAAIRRHISSASPPLPNVCTRLPPLPAHKLLIVPWTTFPV